MIEVNLELLRAAAKQLAERGEPAPLVVSMATWGRGSRQTVLRELEPFRSAWGYNSSLVAAPPREVVARLLLHPELEARPPQAGMFQALGVAYGKVHSEWLPLDGDESGPELI